RRLARSHEPPVRSQSPAGRRPHLPADPGGTDSDPALIGDRRVAQNSARRKTVSETAQLIPPSTSLLAPGLAIGDVSKGFPGVQALSDSSLEVLAGGVHGMVGASG